MITVHEALARMLAVVPQTGVERIPLALAAGRVLACDVVSTRPMPHFATSVMDGYALRFADIPSTFGPTSRPNLRVDGVSCAGSPKVSLRPGTAMRIFTGAPMPAGADTVVMQEDTVRSDDSIVFQSVLKFAQYVRQIGDDLHDGECVLASGTRLGPQHLGIIASLDLPEVLVRRSPRVVFIPTGDELAPPGFPHGDSGIPESNAVALGAFARRACADVSVSPAIPDDPELLSHALQTALRGADLVVTIGGVSVGDYDFVRPALARAGVSLDFWKVAIKPGKPIAFAHGATSLVLGLPGNPSSAMVTFAVFGLPLLRAMQGDARALPAKVRAKLDGDVARNSDRLALLRVALHERDGELWASPDKNQASGASIGLARSDGLAFIEAGPGEVCKGAPVAVLRWSDL